MAGCRNRPRRGYNTELSMEKGKGFREYLKCLPHKPIIFEEAVNHATMLFGIFHRQIVVGGQWLLLQNIPPKGGREVVSTLFRLENHHILFEMRLPLPILSWPMAWCPLETSYGD